MLTSFLVFLQVDKNYVIWKKNVHKKIEKSAKNYMYHKKQTKNFFLRCPPPYQHPHYQQRKHTKNYETFVELFKKLLRFFFLSYTTQYKREELKNMKISILKKKTLEKKSWPTN